MVMDFAMFFSLLGCETLTTSCSLFYFAIVRYTNIHIIVAKALDGQRYPLPLCEYMWVCDGERGSGPEGADDLCLVNFEALGLNLSINNGI